MRLPIRGRFGPFQHDRLAAFHSWYTRNAILPQIVYDTEFPLFVWENQYQAPNGEIVTNETTAHTTKTKPKRERLKPTPRGTTKTNTIRSPKLRTSKPQTLRTQMAKTNVRRQTNEK